MRGRGLRCGNLVFDRHAQGTGPGPLERRAKLEAPDNRVPRCTRYTPPERPAVNSPPLIVELRVTLDEEGQVREARPLGPPRATYSFYISKPMGGGEILGFFPVLEGRSPAPADYLPFVTSALNAVRQWQYVAPANGPIAFDVTFGFAHSSVHVLWEGLGSPGIGPRRVKYVEPAYPSIAQSARVEGTVIVEMHVEPNGHVITARVLRSIPLLDKAAMDLVMQWEFTPTLVNGKPVPVVVTTTLEFTLMH